MSGRSGILKDTAPDRAAISEILSVAMALSNVHTSKSGSWTGGEMTLRGYKAIWNNYIEP
jgi:hypothetical protein